MRAIPAVAVVTSVALLTACSDTPSPTASETSRSPDALVASEAASPVAISPGTIIQTKVNQYPAGTTFLLKRGVHRRQSVVPKSGNRFIGEPGTVLDGERATAFAFGGTANNVTISKLAIRNYKGALFEGAVHAANGSRWTVDSCEISGAATVGIMAGDYTRVRWNRIHDNGRLGIGGEGDSIWIQGNEVSYTNVDRAFNVGYGAGGMKFIKTRWLVVRGNRVHHNVGSGIWVDVDGYDSFFAWNTVEDNTHQGIMYEISYKAVIRENIIRRNGVRQRWLYGAGIFISASPNVEVYGNTLADNAHGITAVEQARGSGAYGPHIVANLYVHNNTVTMRSGQSGIGQDVGSNAVFTTRNNRFVRNTYYLGPHGTPFAWMNAGRTVAQWKAYGQDVDGRFIH